MSSPTRVTAQCHDEANLEKRLTCLADAGPEAITQRLADLGREWSAGRMTKAVIGLMIIVGLPLGWILSPWWLLLPAFGGFLLLQYLFARSSWLGDLFHVMGFRSGMDIEQEKIALKGLRGDFRALPTIHEIDNKDDISRFEGEGGLAIEPEMTRPDLKEAIRNAIQAAKY